MSKGVSGTIAHIYETRYKQLLVFPVLLLIFSLAVVGNHYLKNGEFVSKGVSLKGGTTLSVSKTADTTDLEQSLLSQFPSSDINVRTLANLGSASSFVVEASDVTPEQLLAAVQTHVGALNKNEYTLDTTGPNLGKSFFKQAIIAIIVAFAMMSLVVYIYFRNPLRSFSAVFSVFGDAMLALAMFDIFNMRLTTAGVAAFLMLIGYCIDTDILVTTRVLKGHEGTVSERMAHALPTGLTMTCAAIAAVVVGYYATPSESLKQIMFILFWGLVGDILFTWFFNAPLLRMYVEKKQVHGEHHGV